MNLTEGLVPTSDQTKDFCCGLLAKMALDGAKLFTIRDYPERETSAALFDDSESKVIPIPREELGEVRNWFKLVSENSGEGKYFTDVDSLLLNGPSIQLIAQKCAFEFGERDNDPVVRVALPSVP